MEQQLQVSGVVRSKSCPKSFATDSFFVLLTRFSPSFDILLAAGPGVQGEQSAQRILHYVTFPANLIVDYLGLVGISVSFALTFLRLS